MILPELIGNALNVTVTYLSLEECSGSSRQALTLMLEFTRDQKWIMADATFGTFFAQLIHVSDDGISGTIIITDEKGNIVDTFVGTAPEFQASGEWHLVE
jgi:hypothetical protein